MSTDESADQNGRTAMDFLNAFTSGDLEKAWSMVTDDFHWTLMDKRMGGGMTRHDFSAAFPPLR